MIAMTRAERKAMYNTLIVRLSEYGYSQRDLVSLIDCSQATISGLSNPRSELVPSRHRLESLVLFCEKIGVPTDVK